jgi:uncharacterized membrane protein (UPF0127 family)
MTLRKFLVGMGIGSICALVALVFLFFYLHAFGFSLFGDVLPTTAIPIRKTEITTIAATSTTEYKTTRMNIDGAEITALVADTPALQRLGLGGRAGLATDQGMFFAFPTDQKYSFWMKDMRFSIDMIWISADGHIVHIAPSVSPDTYPTSFAPPSPARYVLEMTAGYAQAHHFKVGDVVHFE